MISMMTYKVKNLFMFKFPSLLVPLILWSGTMVVTVSANIWIARGIPQQCVLLSQSNSLPVRSRITCALQARAFGATMFGFNNQNCDRYEDPNEISDSTMEFEMVLPIDLLEEIASGKKVYASSVSYSFVGGLAVDGDTDTSASTKIELNPFYIVDLGEVRNVHLVRILSKNIWCKGAEIRLGMTLLRTGNFSSYTLFARQRNDELDSCPAMTEYLSCYSLGVPGRYISIQGISPVSRQLYIKEIRVYADKKP